MHPWLINFVARGFPTGRGTQSHVRRSLRTGDSLTIQFGLKSWFFLNEKHKYIKKDFGKCAFKIYFKEEWAVQTVSSSHIAAHPENAHYTHVLRNIIGVTGCKKNGDIVNCVLSKYQLFGQNSHFTWAVRCSNYYHNINIDGEILDFMWWTFPYFPKSNIIGTWK